jgi:hypothetical protein
MLSRPRDAAFTRADLRDALGHRRRLYVLHFLKREPRDRVSLGELVAHVAAWDHGKPRTRLTARERARVEATLCRTHLPALASRGFVDYDPRRRTVGLTAAAAAREFYVGDANSRLLPWSVAYFLLAALCGLALAGVWTGVAPVLLSPAAVVTAAATAFTALALAHVYDDYWRMRVGARTTPPGVE